MADPNRPPGEDDEFFVGYFPMPPGLMKRSLGVAAALLLVAGGVAFAASSFADPPGEARQRSAELDGLFLSAPYGMVRHLDDDGAVRTTLLVRGGKFGAPRAAVARFDDSPVHVSGLLLERDGRELLELHAGVTESTELDADTLATLRAVETESLGEVTVEGEIVDSKCYLGRMRPGGGRTHRACAQLCIAGNIPPVLVAHDARDAHTHYLLASTSNASVSREVLPFVAEPVRVRGALYRAGDLLVLRIDPATIERL